MFLAYVEAFVSFLVRVYPYQGNLCIENRNPRYCTNSCDAVNTTSELVFGLGFWVEVPEYRGFGVRIFLFDVTCTTAVNALYLL